MGAVILGVDHLSDLRGWDKGLTSGHFRVDHQWYHLIQ